MNQYTLLTLIRYNTKQQKQQRRTSYYSLEYLNIHQQCNLGHPRRASAKEKNMSTVWLHILAACNYSTSPVNRIELDVKVKRLICRPCILLYPSLCPFACLCDGAAVFRLVQPGQIQNCFLNERMWVLFQFVLRSTFIAPATFLLSTGIPLSVALACILLKSELYALFRI